MTTFAAGPASALDHVRAGRRRAVMTLGVGPASALDRWVPRGSRLGGRIGGHSAFRARAAILLLAFASALTGCAGLLESPPVPDPEPFPGISGQLGRFGVDVASWTAGDAGCDDPTLSATAIRFTASGLDQPSPVQLRIYIFRNRDAWERRLADVDSCAASWAADPATFELVQVSPYVLAGQGPWPPQFDAAIREGLTAAAGTGG